MQNIYSENQDIHNLTSVTNDLQDVENIIKDANDAKNEISKSAQELKLSFEDGVLAFKKNPINLTTGDLILVKKNKVKIHSKKIFV